MTATTAILNLRAESQEGLVNYLKNVRARYAFYYNIRSVLEEADVEYYREHDWTKEAMRGKLANRVGDASKFRDITVPVVMPQVEAFVTYQTSVFLSGEPIFGVVASPKYADAAIQMEATISDQSTRAGWRAELIKFFRDCGKYSLGAVEVSWDKVNTPAFETDLSFSTTQAKPKNVIWEGNTLKKLDLYNTFWDTSVHPHDVATKGEYAGYNELISRVQLKQYIAGLDDAIVANVKEAFHTGTPVHEYYIPQINPQALASLNAQTQGMDWFSWAGIAGGRTDIVYKSAYIRTTLYVRMLPSEFGIRVPQPNTPQVWKLVFINFQTIIYAERLTNAHGMIPILFGCPNDDGIKYQTKSLGANVQPMQQVATTMMNSLIASRRRAISDRGLYNPLYIESKDINSSNPAAKIPVKPTAYAGVSLSEMYYPIPFNDDQAPVLMQSINTMMSFADIISGQNKAQQGQFVKGNKTQHEYQDVMSSANGRSQLSSIALEDTFFCPMKYIISTNILQFQGADTLYHSEKKQDVEVDPLVLRNAILKFKISDGLMPSDKLMNADAWQTAMQVIGSSPAIGPAYNIAPMFSYLMKTQGADISDFEKSQEQQQYEQALGQWQQAIGQILKANPQAGQDQFPPQPKPADYGIAPDGSTQSGKAKEKQQESTESLIQKIMEADAGSQSESSEPAGEA